MVAPWRVSTSSGGAECGPGQVFLACGGTPPGAGDALTCSSSALTGVLCGVEHIIDGWFFQHVNSASLLSSPKVLRRTNLNSETKTEIVSENDQRAK